MISTNSIIIKSQAKTQSTKKLLKKYNLNKLNYSLTNTIENSSFVMLKDGTIKKKRHKNSYLEEYLDNKRLLMTLEEATTKIRRPKSCANDNRKKNLFYKTNFWHFKKNDKIKRNSDNNIFGKVQRINMLENDFINDKLNEEINDLNNLEVQYRFSHNNYINKLNLGYNDRKSGVKKYKSNKKKKIINSNNKKYDDEKEDVNKYENLIGKKNKYKNLGKFLNKKEIKLNKNNGPLEFNDFNFAFNNTVKNKDYNEYKNNGKFDVTFKNISKDDNIDSKEKSNKDINSRKDNEKDLEKQINNSKIYEIINNEKIQYNSDISENSNKMNNSKKNSIEQCRINSKNTNFVSKILSDEISPIKQKNCKYQTNDLN